MMVTNATDEAINSLKIIVLSAFEYFNLESDTVLELAISKALIEKPASITAFDALITKYFQLYSSEVEDEPESLKELEAKLIDCLQTLSELLKSASIVPGSISSSTGLNASKKFYFEQQFFNLKQIIDNKVIDALQLKSLLRNQVYDDELATILQDKIDNLTCTVNRIAEIKVDNQIHELMTLQLKHTKRQQSIHNFKRLLK